MVLGRRQHDDPSRDRQPELNERSGGQELLDGGPAGLGIERAPAPGAHEKALRLGIDEFVVGNHVGPGAKKDPGDRMHETGPVGAVDQEHMLGTLAGFVHGNEFVDWERRVKPTVGRR